MSAVPEPQLVLSFEDARHVVEEHAAKLRPTGTEKLDLLQASGRVLAEPIHADRDFPPFPRAARDGYAVRASDLLHLPATLEVIAEIKAGAAPEDLPESVKSGQAVAIMTGAPAPHGTNAVVMVEYTKPKQDYVEISRAVRAGDNIVPAGSEAREGDLLLAAGTRLTEAAIAVAASVGKPYVQVYTRPKVAVLSTGDEVVPIDTQPGPNQIRNSNSYSLAAQIMAAGAEPVLLPIAPDEPNQLSQLIRHGLQYDLLLLAGGVSMGKYDLVEAVMAGLEAGFFFTGAQIQPGRPVVFGRAQNKYFFGLPGNPVSTMVTFDLFVRPMLDALAGATPRKLVFLHARLKTDVKTKTGLKRFLPAILSGEFEGVEVELAGWHGSGDIATTARSNCYILIPPDRDRICAGEWVPVLLR
ncbi:MAG: molybdopterin molybdenumtransferase MoeA [Acidobacteria bacterium]|nr:MAG: molybdopterin molybdenumtransferase MoeA [Acidobacteriota bacterium]PYY10360.1 MAG: molybdopterin molybdenumtransferase MoeA [Acidobacteriota bacterium]